MCPRSVTAATGAASTCCCWTLSRADRHPRCRRGGSAPSWLVSASPGSQFRPSRRQRVLGTAAGKRPQTVVPTPRSCAAAWPLPTRHTAIVWSPSVPGMATGHRGTWPSTRTRSWSGTGSVSSRASLWDWMRHFHLQREMRRGREPVEVARDTLARIDELLLPWALQGTEARCVFALYLLAIGSRYAADDQRGAGPGWVTWTAGSSRSSTTWSPRTVRRCRLHRLRKDASRGGSGSPARGVARWVATPEPGCSRRGPQPHWHRGVGAGLLALAVAITRGSSKVEAGAFFTATALFLLATNVGQLGTSSSLVYFLSSSRATGRVRNAPVYLRLALVPVLLVAAVLGTALFIWAEPAGHLLGNTRGDSHGPLGTAVRQLAPSFPGPRCSVSGWPGRVVSAR